MIPAPWLWHIEVGTRAALHTQYGIRDERWWFGLWNRRRA